MWVQGRSQLEGVADFLGQPPQLVAALPPVPGGAAAFAVYGYAVLPPHGHPNASRQCVHVNGRWVKAPPVSKWVLHFGCSPCWLAAWQVGAAIQLPTATTQQQIKWWPPYFLPCIVHCAG